MVDVALKGLSNNPNDYLSDDGDLAFATNVSAGVDGLRTVGGSEVVVENWRANLSGCFYVHRAENATVYICKQEAQDFNGKPDGVKLTFYEKKYDAKGEIEKDTQPQYHKHFKKDIYDITSVGNTLIVSAPDGNHYFLLKAETGYDSANNRTYTYKYEYLGNCLPNLDGIQFALQAHHFRKELMEELSLGEKVAFNHYIEEEDLEFTSFSTKVRDEITEKVMAGVNKHIKEEGVDKNRFIFPFFVRCALRLYNGDLTMHTAPIYIETASEETVFLTGYERMETYDLLEDVKFHYANVERIDYITMHMFCHDLQYKINTKFSDWKDIIRSVDIFVSSPLYTHEQEGKIEGAWWWDFGQDKTAGSLDRDREGYDSLTYSRFGLKWKTGERGISSKGQFWDRSHGICKVVDYERKDDETTGYDESYEALKEYLNYYRPQNPFIFSQTMYSDKTDNEYKACFKFRIGNRSAEEFDEMRSSESTFFLLKSIPVDNLHTGTGFKTIDLKDGYLQSLVNREVMTGEFRVNDQWFSERLISYNKRLFLGNISFLPWRGFQGKLLGLYCDIPFPPTWSWLWLGNEQEMGGTVKWWKKYKDTSYLYYTVRLGVLLEEDMCNNYVESVRCDKVPEHFALYFYPNPKAKYLRVTVSYQGRVGDTPTQKTHDYLLSPHKTLNGAYLASELNLRAIFRSTGADKETFDEFNDGKVPYGKYVAVSEVNNPFLFRAENIRTIGDGRLLALKSAATPISEGQYGQYPVYAFTSAGIYSLPIRDDGSVGQEQWLNTDIVTNPKAISYVDGGVVYPTDHGMKALRGGDTTVMSEAVHAVADVEAYFPALPSEGKPYGGIPKFDVLLTQVVGDAAKSYKPHNIRNYLMDCSCCYDARNSRIIFYSDSDWVYHLTLDMKSRQWGVCPKMLRTAFEMELPYGLDYDNNIIDYSKINESVKTKHKGLVVTRPIKLGSDDYKKVRSLKALGHFAKGGVQLVLWGSRDLHKWHLIGSSTTDTLRNLGGTSYKYFRVGMILDLAPQEVVTSLRFTDEVGG